MRPSVSRNYLTVFSAEQRSCACSAIINVHRYQLLSLLLIQTFVALAVPFVDGSVPKIIDISKIGKISGGTPLIKSYQLVSGCSKKYVIMDFKRRIHARGRKDDVMGRLNFMSDPSGSGSIWIKGDAVKKFLCFSRNGRLINRTNGGSSRCKFNEQPHQNYIKLQSVANAKWYVGFKKNGRKMKGFAKKDRWKREKCFMFIKMEFGRDKTNKQNTDDTLVNMVDSLQQSYHSQDKYRGQR